MPYSMLPFCETHSTLPLFRLVLLCIINASAIPACEAFCHFQNNPSTLLYKQPHSLAWHIKYLGREERVRPHHNTCSQHLLCTLMLLDRVVLVFVLFVDSAGSSVLFHNNNNNNIYSRAEEAGRGFHSFLSSSQIYSRNLSNFSTKELKFNKYSKN